MQPIIPTNSGSRSIVTRIANFTKAWEEIAPEALFAGMTLAEFKTAMAKALNVRASNNALRLLLRAGVGSQRIEDSAARDVTDQIVEGVKANNLFGPNSPLYRAMGFIPKSECRTGKAKSPSPTPPTA